MPCYVRNFQICKEIETPRQNYFIQHLNLDIHLSLDNIENSVLKTLAEYNHKNPINGKNPKTVLSLNTLL